MNAIMHAILLSLLRSANRFQQQQLAAHSVTQLVAPEFDGKFNAGFHSMQVIGCDWPDSGMCGQALTGILNAEVCIL